MSEKLILMKRDALIEPIERPEFKQSIIEVVHDDNQKEKINFFKVLQVSDNVTMFKAGDIVLLEYLQHTIPMEWEGKRCAVTSEDDVVGVIDQ